MKTFRLMTFLLAAALSVNAYSRDRINLSASLPAGKYNVDVFDTASGTIDDKGGCVVVSDGNAVVPSPELQSKGDIVLVLSPVPATASGVMDLLGNASRENRILFGQQDYPYYGHDWEYEEGRSDCRDVVGDVPAVLGCELGDLELGHECNLDGVPFDTMRKWIIAHSKKGPVTISWHCNNPATGGNAWDCTGNDAVKSVLKGGKNHEKFMSWIGAVAEFLLSLRDECGNQIPILFRPWHEHTGSWFWWGERQCSRDEYVSLWEMTVSALKSYGLDELLFVYSPSSNSSETESLYMNKYPGDDFVDVLGLDYYYNRSDAGFAESLRQRLSMISRIAGQRGKLFALTETGNGGLSHESWWTEVLMKGMEGTGVSYVLVWRNANVKRQGQNHYFVPYLGGKGIEDFVKFYDMEDILFLDDLPCAAKESEMK